MKNFRSALSKKILDAVEGLPKFRKGIISDLQDIRERQRRFLLTHAAYKKLPDSAEINLNSIAFILTFEYEEFPTLIKGLRRYFKKMTG